VAVAGFTPESLLAAIYSVIRQQLENNIFLDNCYPQLVSAHGNPTAKKYLTETMQVVDATWRGIGKIANSGFVLKNSKLDVKSHFFDYSQEARKYEGAMPPGCECAQVVLGKIYPNQCPLYAAACTPRTPIGPCMVSDEGACRIWWSGGVRDRKI